MSSDLFGARGAETRPKTLTRSDTSNLADILERVLDKGIVVAGDIVVSLVDVELLTIRLRLLIASVDKAKEMGINWWENDPWLSTSASQADRDGVGDGSHPAVADRLERLETAVGRLAAALEDGRRGQ